MRKVRGTAVAVAVLVTMVVAPAVAWGAGGERAQGDVDRGSTLVSTVLETAQVGLAGWLDQAGGLLTAVWDLARGVIVPGDPGTGDGATSSATTMNAPAGGA